MIVLEEGKRGTGERKTEKGMEGKRGRGESGRERRKEERRERNNFLKGTSQKEYE